MKNVFQIDFVSRFYSSYFCFVFRLCVLGAADVDMGEWMYGQLERAQMETIHGKQKKVGN